MYNVIVYLRKIFCFIMSVRKSLSVVEGGVKIDVYEGVFYNPRAKMNRSIGVLFLKSLGDRKNLRVLDGLSGTGVRGIRYLLESDYVSEVILNDRSYLAYQNILHNLRINNVISGFEVYREDVVVLSSMLKSVGVDVIDLDPFGSPQRYLPSAVYALNGKGYLMYTATDLMTLCGVVEDSLWKIYGVNYVRNDFCHEIAIRILIKEGVLQAAKLGFSARPVFASFDNHYIRVFLEFSRRRGSLDSKDIGYLVMDEDGWSIVSFKEMKSGEISGRVIGPIWIGSYIDVSLLDRMVDVMSNVPWSDNNLKSFIMRIAQDDTSIPIIYRLSSLCRRLRVRMPSINELRDAIEGLGYRFSRSYLYYDGFRTDASIGEVVKIVLSLSSEQES